MIDLQPFCSTDECRPYLMKPFSRGGHTFATNGHIMVKVTLRPDVPDVEKQFNQNNPLKGIESVTFDALTFSLPSGPQETGACPSCDGRGTMHACPDCVCDCERCDGEGELNGEKRASTTIGEKNFNLHYVRQILSLPGVEFALSTIATDDAKPMFFRFSEGVGALMPLRGTFINHVIIQSSANGTRPVTSEDRAPA